MIITLPRLTVLNALLLLLHNEPATVQAAFTIPSLTKTLYKQPSLASSSSSSALNARPNPDIDISDPYASLINKINIKADLDVSPSSSSSISPSIPTPDLSTSTSSTTMQSLADKVNELVEQVNQAASVAIEASNQVSEIGSSASDVVITTTATAVTAAASTPTTSASTLAPTTTTTTSSMATDGITTSIQTTSQSSNELEVTLTSVTNKVPTLFEYIKNGDAFKHPVAASTANDIVKVKKNVNVNYDVNNVIPTTKNIIDTTSQNLNEITQSAKTLMYSVGAAAVSSGTTPYAASADSASATAGGAIVEAADPITLKTIMDNFKFDIYGSWYLAGATFLYAVSARNMGRDEMREEYERELNIARVKAVEAADAAVEAAEGARLVKKLVEEIEGQNESKAVMNVGEVLLENAKIQEIAVENDLMKQKLLRLETENAEQKTVIYQLTAKLNDPASSTTDSTVIGEEKDIVTVTTKAIPVIKETMERDPKEDAKFIQIIKEIDEENALLSKKAVKKVSKKKQPKTAPKKVKRTTEVKKTQVTAKKTEVKAKKAKAKKTEVKAKKTEVKAQKTEVKAKETKTEVRAKVKKAPAKKVQRKAKKAKVQDKEKEKVEPKVEAEVNGATTDATIVGATDDFKEIKAAEDMFMDAISQIASEAVDQIRDIDAKNVLDKNSKVDVKNEIMDALAGLSAVDETKKMDVKGQGKKKNQRKVQETTKKPKVVAVSNDEEPKTNPWGGLKQSTLQRKTIAQLTAYLEEREVNVSGLSKKELVGTIQSL